MAFLYAKYNISSNIFQTENVKIFFVLLKFDHSQDKNKHGVIFP